MEESKKEVENGCFGRMMRSVLPLSLGERTIARRGEGGGDERGETVASINGKESLSAIYGMPESGLSAS